MIFKGFFSADEQHQILFVWLRCAVLLQSLRKFYPLKTGRLLFWKLLCLTQVPKIRVSEELP